MDGVPHAPETDEEAGVRSVNKSTLRGLVEVGRTHLRPAIWQACVYHTWRDSFLWQPSLAHLLIPSRPSIPTPFFLSGKHGTNSLQNNESAPQGNVQVRKAFKKKKSQGLCISRPAAEPPEGRAGDRSAPRSPGPNLPATACLWCCLPTTPNRPAHTSGTAPLSFSGNERFRVHPGISMNSQKLFIDSQHRKR